MFFAHDPAANLVALSCGNRSTASCQAMESLLRGAGFAPIFIDSHAARTAQQNYRLAKKLVEKSAAIVVMGNDDDIHPETYGHKEYDCTRSEKCQSRATFERRLIQLALETKRPLLGICGGMQRINVMLGGTLHQDIDLVCGRSAYDALQEWEAETHTVAGTWMHSCISADKAIAAKYHHQAVDRLAPGLIASAHCGLGFIEAIEPERDGLWKEHKLLGVQFHPEMSSDAQTRGIVTQFLLQAD